MQERTESPAVRWQDAWATRPARPRSDRKIAGVAAALAHRYAVDPVLVRVAFVAAAFYGPGIPLYLLGCALLPDEQRTGRGRAGALVSAVLVVAAVLAAVLLFGPDGGWVAPLLVCVGLLAALHVARGTVGPAAVPGPVSPADPADPSTTAAPAATTAATTAATAPTAAVPTAPPTWDPLGAAPFAWDLPEPGPENGPEPPPSSTITPVTLGLALLAGGIALAGAVVVPDVVGPAAVPGAALAVIGVGLVVGAFRHAGRWLLPFALLLGVATWLASAVPWGEFSGGVGSIAQAPRTVASVAPEYRRGVGDVSLDLSGLDLRTPPGGAPPTVRTAARVGVGSISVVVPPGADVVVRGRTRLGDVTVEGQSRSGTSAALEVDDPGSDGPGGGRIELDVSATLGSVTVARG